MNNSPFLTLSEVASYLGFHDMTVYRHVKKGLIPMFKIAGRWRIRKDDLDKWILKESNESVK